jgi:Dolichyl-phosphate-mannose-protein mannosyltransferase
VSAGPRTLFLAPSAVTPQAISSRRALVLVSSAAGAVALIIRLALHGSSFDVFGDEVIYTDLGRSVISGGFPRFEGTVFFLHGPAFFYLEAGWARLAGNQPSLVAWIYEMRVLNALLAGATAVVLVVLAARASSLRAAAATGAMFALDPFCIRQNDRVLLETAMMLWVLLGYLILSSLIRRPAPARPVLRSVGAGLLFGCAVLTKDEAALLTVLPLAAAVVMKLGLRRPVIAVTLGTTLAVYGAYLAMVAANGYWATFWYAKTYGVQRLLGLVQVTGFHSSGGGSLPARLIAEGAYFATTYIVLALGGPAVLLALRRGGSLTRLLALVHCAAAITLAYAVALGTLEEQELYLLIVPTLLTIPMTAALPRPADLARHARVMSARMPVLAAVLALALSVNLATVVLWARQPDDGFAELMPYMAAHIRAGTAITIAAGSPPPSQTDGGRYALEDRYKVGLWVTSAALRQEHVRYVMVEWGPIDEGYSYLSPARVRRLIRGDRLVFSYRGRTYGQLALYQRPAPRHVLEGGRGQPGAGHR